MKYEINIEIERTTIIGNHTPNTSETQTNNDVIEVTAKEIPTETGFRIIEKKGEKKWSDLRCRQPALKPVHVNTNNTQKVAFGFQNKNIRTSKQNLSR